MIAGPFLAACALLAIAGFAKITRPAATHAATAAAGIRVPRLVVVGFGGFEVGAAVAGAAFGGLTAYAVAAGYVFLTAFAIRLLVRAPSTPCGCLGSPTAVVTRTHVALNAGCAVGGFVAARSGSPVYALSDDWLRGSVLLVLAGCSVRLAALALETLPALTAATREGAA